MGYNFNMNSKVVDFESIVDRVLRRLDVSAHDRFVFKDKLDGLVEEAYRQGNFTVVVLKAPAGNISGLGVSKRSPCDGVDSVIGYNIALTRAVESVVTAFMQEASTKQKRKQK